LDVQILDIQVVACPLIADKAPIGFPAPEIHDDIQDVSDLLTKPGGVPFRPSVPARQQLFE